MTLEMAANVLLDTDAPAEERAEAARVANEERSSWGDWPAPIPIPPVQGREYSICSLCALDLEENEIDDGASAHDACLLDEHAKVVQAWSPVVRAAVEFEAYWSKLVGHAPESDKLAAILTAVRALQASDRPFRNPEDNGGPK